MRGGVVAAGVVMMVVGALLFFYSPDTLGSGSSLGTSLTNVASTAFFGLVLGFIGFLVFIAGLAASPEHRYEPSPSRYRLDSPGEVAPSGPGPWMSGESAPAGILMSRCLRCGFNNPYYEMDCRNCGQKLPDLPPPDVLPRTMPAGTSQTAQPMPPPTPQVEPVPPTVASVDSTSTVEEGGYCPFCGRKSALGYRFCRACGKPLE